MSEHITHTASIKRLERSSSDRMVAGVAVGLGRYFDINASVFRLGFVVLTLLGGAGILVYLAAVLVMPVEGREQFDRRPDPRRAERAAGTADRARPGRRRTRSPALPRRPLARRRRRLGADPDRRPDDPLGEPRQPSRPQDRDRARRDRVAPRDRGRDRRSSSPSPGSTSASPTGSATAPTNLRRQPPSSPPTRSAIGKLGIDLSHLAGDSAGARQGKRRDRRAEDRRAPQRDGDRERDGQGRRRERVAAPRRRPRRRNQDRHRQRVRDRRDGRSRPRSKWCAQGDADRRNRRSAGARTTA